MCVVARQAGFSFLAMVKNPQTKEKDALCLAPGGGISKRSEVGHRSTNSGVETIAEARNWLRPRASSVDGRGSACAAHYDAQSLQQLNEVDVTYISYRT